MQISVTFDTAENRNAFAAKTGYVSADSVTLEAHASLLALAKAATGYVSAAHSGAAGQAIVKSNLPGSESLGDGFYLTNTSDFVALFDSENGSAEPADSGIKLMSELTGAAVTDPTTADAQWARIRVANRFRPFSTEFVVNSTVVHARKPEVIVVDSGINFNHPEFAGLETENFYKLSVFSNFDDEAGHGTAVASAVAGANVGVNNYVKLVNAKIFESAVKPSLLQLGETMDAILARHTADPTTARVVNMSWNTPKSAYLEGKINALCEAGIIVVCAAGNFGGDVADLTPAGMPQVITVAASDKDDVAAGFNDFAAADQEITTNVGLHVDFFAPGVDVTLAKNSGGYIKPSGTSASAGYASGCVSSLVSMWPTWPQSFATVVDTLAADAVSGVLLVDPAKVTEKQNRLIHLPNAGTDIASYDYYLGTFTSDTAVISGDFGPIIELFKFQDQTITYSVVWDDAALEAEFGSSVVVDAATGQFTVNKPTVSLPSDVTLKLVRFKIRAATDTASVTGTPLIFFYPNPDYNGDLTTEVASALENINSQSFFAAWIWKFAIK